MRIVVNTLVCIVIGFTAIRIVILNMKSGNERKLVYARTRRFPDQRRLILVQKLTEKLSIIPFRFCVWLMRKVHNGVLCRKKRSGFSGSVEVYTSNALQWNWYLNTVCQITKILKSDRDCCEFRTTRRLTYMYHKNASFVVFNIDLLEWKSFSTVWLFLLTVEMHFSVDSCRV